MGALFRRFVPVSTDEARIHLLLTRGVERVYPSEAYLGKRLRSGERLRVYLGIDPTAPTLHLGHAIPLLKLREFQDLGHEVVLLFGDFTATVGDPTGKLTARQALSKSEALQNVKVLRREAGIFLRLKGANPARIACNAEWLRGLPLGTFMNVSSRFTVEQILKRDMFEERMKTKKPIFLNEFLYPILQGYDSAALDVDGEIGGNDQTFNMLVGRDIVKALRGKEKFVLATKLLIDSAGKKMGKTTGNFVSVSEKPPEMFGRVMSFADTLIIPGFELCTTLTAQELEELRLKLMGGAHPRDLKLRLAEEIVSLCHGRSRALEAREEFLRTFQEGGTPKNPSSLTVSRGSRLQDIIVSAKLVSSKSEFRRLLREGAITDAVSGEKFRSVDAVVDREGVIRIGKHRFLRIRIKLHG